MQQGSTLCVAVRDEAGTSLAHWSLPVATAASVEVTCDAANQSGTNSGEAQPTRSASTVRISVLPCLKDSLFTMWVMGEVDDAHIVARCGIKGLDEFRERLQAARHLDLEGHHSPITSSSHGSAEC